MRASAKACGRIRSPFSAMRGKQALPGHEGLDRLIANWEDHTQEAGHELHSEATRQLVFDLLESQRQHLKEANLDPAIDEEIIRHELYLIDLEEERLRLRT